MTRACRFWIAVILGVLSMPWRPVCAQPSEGLSAVAALEQALTQVIEQAEPSVVSVARLRLGPNDLVRGPELRGRAERGPFSDAQDPAEILPNQFGAGVIVAPPQSDERFVLTAYHLVRGGPTAGQTGSGDGSTLEVRFPSEHACSATIFAADPRCDLAVLKLDYQQLRLKPAQLRPLSWSAAAPVRKGQFVVTLGNPYWIARDGSASAAWGIVSNLVRRPAALAAQAGGPPTLFGLGTSLQIEQRLPVGSSGGPVLNLRGELVGLASSLAAIEGYERSGGFAIPLDGTTRWIVETLLAGHEVEYGLLGLTPTKVTLRDGLAEKYGQPTAAQVQKLPLGSPAQLAGVREGDFVLAVDGQPTRSELDLMRLATLHPPETPVPVLLVRGGAELTLKVKLGKWPVSDEEGIVASVRRHPLWRGLAVDYPTGRKRFFESVREVPAAVVITEVVPDSPSHTARLQPGEFITHVNNTPVKTPAEFAEAVKSLKRDVTLRFQTRDDAGRTVVVKE
jgi:serine protease Do